jgi:DNA (cytosine-5)-methyltransferase 1
MGLIAAIRVRASDVADPMASGVGTREESVNGLALRPPSTYVSVCSGVGGLDLGLHAAIPGLEPVVYIEREAHAAAVLVARMEEAALLAAPVWDDVSTFDARGTPCQNLSLAGKRQGLHGDRSRLFFEHVRLAVECEAHFFFWENVAGAIGVIPAVAEHLHANGYTAIVWCVLRARDVGAPHERARVFLLAYSERFALRQQPGRRGGKDWACPAQSGLAGADVAHPGSPGLEERGTLRRDGEPQRSSAVGDRLGLFPPGRDDRDAWARVLAVNPELAPARAQPRLRGLAHGLGAGVDVCVCPREDRLRATGNGVVRQQAERAWQLLWDALCRRLIGGQRT